MVTQALVKKTHTFAFCFLPAVFLSGCAFILPIDRERGSYSNSYSEAGEVSFSSKTRGSLRTSSLSGLPGGNLSKIKFLIARLGSSSDVVRTNAATDLGMYGRLAEVAVPNLSKIVASDDSKWARRAAVKSLARIGTTEAISAIRQALKDPDYWVRHSARNVLGRVT